MIRLKLLLEGVKSIPNVLFVSDRPLDRRRSFARKLFSNRKCTGEIRIVDNGSSADLRDLVNLYGSSYYDLIVVLCRGIYETSGKSDIDLIKANYDIIISYCHGLNVPVCFSTFPSLQFVDDKFKDKIHFTLADDKKLDRWLRDHADYILDTTIFDDDVYFEDNGIFLNRNAHNILYNEMLTILDQLNIKAQDVDTKEPDAEQEELVPILKFRDAGSKVDELQTLLTALGYNIKFSELMSKQFGRSTELTVNKFKKEHGLDDDGTVDEETMDAIHDAIDELERSKNKKPEKHINLYGFEIGDVDSDKVMLGGINGDWAGSLQKALEIAKVASDFVGHDIIMSQKRSRVRTASGNVSDHWVENLDTYAVDLSTGANTPENLEKGDELLAHIMEFLGDTSYVGGHWLNLETKGYRYQIGWKVPDHFDHIHVGVKKI